MKALLVAALEFLGEKLWRRWFPKVCDHTWTDIASSGAGKLQECLRCSKRRFNPPAPPDASP
jgi:hypothetical protein